MRAATVANRQRGALTRAQLNGAGLSDKAIARRVRSGWLVRLHHGVYGLGRIGPLGHAQAALLACGPEAVTSHRTAAAMWSLLPYPPAVSVTVPRHTRRPPKLIVHELKHLPPWTLRHGLRTTTVPQTLLDLAASAGHDETTQAVNQAHVDRRTTTAALLAFLASQTGRRGAAVLKSILEGPRTRSPLEIEFFKLLRAARLPLPVTNVKVNGHRVDFYWPEHNLIVETDGWAAHGNRQQFERDRVRDLDHAAAHVRVIRITARQLTREPHAISARLGAVLLQAINDVP